jgi:signal transduction histidine kinase
MGLLGLEERVGRLAGRLDISSSPGNGTSIHVTLPVPAEEKEEVSR